MIPKNIDQVFWDAARLASPGERAAFLDHACAGDPALRREVDELLAARSAAGSFLEIPAVGRPNREADAAARIGSAGSDAELPSGFLAPSDMPGAALGRVGHYDVQEVVGRGGMGFVLKAFDGRLHRVVAVKVMAPQLAAVASARQRFAREGRAAAAVAHDHIVTIHAVEEADRLPYLVMQYVAGQSLQDRLDKAGTLPLTDILRIGMQTASGLAAAHAQGLVHRDVKPANILLENGVERVKLTDFGLARAADDASLTQSGVIAGTPQYMSPEQAEGKPVDSRSDLFSLGSVLYAMCTGCPPFRAIGSMAVLKRVCEDTPPPVREANPEVPDWLGEVIAKLHAKDPAGRFQTAAEVADLLGRHLAHLQNPALYSNSSHSNPSPRTGSTMQTPNSPEQAAAPQPRNKSRLFLKIGLGLVVIAAGVWYASTFFDTYGVPSASADEPSRTWPDGPVATWVKPVEDIDGQMKKAPERKAGTEEKVVPVSIETTLGGKQRSEAQKKFAKSVADMGTRRQVIKVDGQEFPVPAAGSNGEVDPQKPMVGYKLEKDHFATFTYESKVIARSIEETLFAVNDANIYPGRVFLANPYLQNGEVTEVNVSSEVWAPIKVAIYSPTLKTNEGGKLFDTPTAYGTPANEVGRLQQFKQVQAGLIRGVNSVAAWKELTQTTYSQSHLGLQASLRVSGGWGSVAASAKYDENQENATVYMLLTQESYRISVDDADTAAGWIVGDPRPDDLAKICDPKSPLLYVSEVIYGRVILVTATSQLSSDDLKIALSGDAKVWKQRIEAEGKYDKETKLAATTFNILCYGGTAQPGAHLKFEEYSKELTRLKTAELTTATAMPIAYKACWLADKTPASWVGVTPLRTYKVVRDPISYTVKVKDYFVKDTHCTQEVVVGRHWATRRAITDTRPADGSMVIAARDLRKEYKDDYKIDMYAVRTGGNRQHSPNFTLINRQPVPELPEDKKFDLRIRQGENGDPKNWDDLKSNGGAFREHTIEVNVQELLNTDTKERPYTIDFDDGNKVTILVRINAPVVPKLGEPPPLRKPETGSK